MSDRRQEHEIEIDASRDAVWKAITDAEELTRWYVEDARVEPGEGGSQWVSWGQGTEVETRHQVWKPGERLVLTAPEGKEPTGWNAIVIEYTLESAHGKTRLRLVQSGMPEGPEWDGAYEGTNVGWRMFLTALKFYLERHPGRARRTIYRYGHVMGDRSNVWATLLGRSLVAASGSFDGLGAGDTFAVTAVTGDPLEGRLLLVEPGRNFTASVSTLGDALIQFDVTKGKARCFVNFVLATFGSEVDAHADLAERWRPHLEAVLSVDA